MGQRVIPVAVTAEYIGGDGVTLGAAGSHNSVLIEYDFRSAGPQWDDISGRYVLWTNPQGNSTNRINLGVSEKVEGYEGVYQAAPPADAMCVPGWAEMVVVGFTMDGDKEVTKIKTEPSRFRVLPGSSRAADNEGVAPTVADQLQAEIEAVNDLLESEKVNKPVSPHDANGAAGQVLESLGDGRTRWVDHTGPTDEQVERVLAQHPTWTTTVQDGAVSEQKLTDASVTKSKIADGAVSMDKLDDTMLQNIENTWFAERTEFFDYPMLALQDSNVFSMEGVCVIEERYICTVRYSGSSAENRLFEIWDPDTKSKVSELTLASSVVGHCNSATYDNGMLYVTTFKTGQEIACLKYDKDERVLAFDRYINTGGIALTGLAAKNGVFYGFDGGTSGTIDGKLLVYRSDDLETWTVAFRTDLDGMRDMIVPQGFEYDGHYLYFPSSGVSRQEDTSLSNAEMLPRKTERIYVTDMQGYVQKQFAFRRGAYEEIEDVAVYQKNGKRYLLVGLNQDDYHVCHVHIMPLTKDAENSRPYGSDVWTGTYSNSINLFPVYVDTANGTPFGIGVSGDPFKSLPIALSFIKRHNIRACIYFSGTMFNCEILNMPQMLNIHFQNGSKITHDVIIRDCPFIAIYGDGTTPCEIGGSFTAENTQVAVKGNVKLTNTFRNADNQPKQYAIEVYRGFFTGRFVSVADYACLVRTMLSIINIDCPSISASGMQSVGDASILSVNNQFLAREEN